MDPIAHTLVGAALARAGLEKRSSFAGVALVVGANLPDIDGLTYFASSDLGLYFRRGWTHGLPAVALWPFALAGALTLLDRALGRRKARFGALFWLSLLAVATHPSLDWLNNYGMRWLMPFHGRWFYGDAVFIIDPWIWLVLGGALFLATSSGILGLLAWSLGGAALSFLVMTGVSSLLPGKLLFALGLVALAALRGAGLPRTEASAERLHRGALAFVAIYIGAMVALSAFAYRWTLRNLTEEGYGIEKLMVAPTPMSPFTKDVVFSTKSSYRYGSLSLWPPMRLSLSQEILERSENSALASRALQQPEVQGFATWVRFPWAEVAEETEGFRVTLRDARYARILGSRGFGSASVFLPRGLSWSRPSPPPGESRRESP
jgi:inner membrane protein